MRFFVRLAAAALLALVTTEVESQERAPFDYDNLPARQWVQLGEPTREIPAGITAYSGMCIDPVRQQILLFGGGHNDYWGNEVWAWHIPTRTLKRLTEPTPRETYLTAKFDWDHTPGMFPEQKLPVSRHTYDAVEWIDHLGLMYAGGSSTYSSNDKERVWERYVLGAQGVNNENGWNPGDVWLFDPANNSWTYRRVPEELRDGGATCAYAADRKQLVRWDRRGTFLYDVGQDRWKKIESEREPDAAIHRTMTYDSRRKCCYLVGGDGKGSDKLWKLALDHRQWSLVETQGKSPILRDGVGSAYDAEADVLVTYGKTGLWVYDPAKNVWIENPASAEPPRTREYGSQAELYGRLKYDPIHKLVLMVIADHSRGVEVWGYRYGKE